MKKLVLTTAVALLAGTALAAAQGMNAQQAPGGNKTERAAPAPQAQQQAPAEKTAPAKQAQTPSKARETTGQAPKADVNSDTKAGADIKANDTKANDTKTNATQNDKAGAAKSDNKASMDSKTKSSMDNKANDKNKSASDNKANDNNKSAMDNKANDKNGKSSAQNNNARDKNNTTGQGAAGAKGAANLSTEQRTKIRTVIKEKVHVQPLTHVNFSISIGTRVPRDVHFYPVPAEVISIYPEWRGYQLILVNNQYIIVDPATYEIVYIIA
jgi:hypothetical protein